MSNWAVKSIFKKFSKIRQKCDKFETFRADRAKFCLLNAIKSVFLAVKVLAQIITKRLTAINLRPKLTWAVKSIFKKFPKIWKKCDKIEIFWAHRPKFCLLNGIKGVFLVGAVLTQLITKSSTFINPRHWRHSLNPSGAFSKICQESAENAAKLILLERIEQSFAYGMATKFRSSCGWFWHN